MFIHGMHRQILQRWIDIVAIVQVHVCDTKSASKTLPIQLAGLQLACKGFLRTCMGR